MNTKARRVFVCSAEGRRPFIRTRPLAWIHLWSGSAAVAQNFHLAPARVQSYTGRMLLRFLAMLLLAGPLSAEEDGFTPLFNGKDLTGWVNVNCAPETWNVKEGMIHCDGVPTGALRTVKQYENFVLELEWRHLKPGGNAGVFIWASPLSAPGVPFLRAVEVQVLDTAYGDNEGHTTHGDVFPIHGSTMNPFGRHNGQRAFPSESRSKPSPEWNHYRVTCQDGTVRLAVNGKEVTGGEQCNWRKGYLGLESEGGVVDWRNIKIKELPGAKATAEQSAPLADGSVSIYDGRSLKGWTLSKEPVPAWRAEDWELVTAGSEGTLTLDKKLNDFRLQFDVRTDGKEGKAPLPVCINGKPLTGAATGKWTRYVVTRSGAKLACNPEGVDGAFTAVEEGPVTISLKSGTAVRVAGIYLKELVAK